MSDTKLDYRKILVWYINHVGTCEGVDFLGERYEPNFNRSRLTSEEWKELNRLSEEANIEYYWEETMSILVDEYIQSTAAGLAVNDFVIRVLRRLISGHIIMDKINHGITTADSASKILGQSDNQYVVTNSNVRYIVGGDPVSD